MSDSGSFKSSHRKILIISSLVALQAGGYTHSWHSAYVLCCLIIGILVTGAWIVWEAIFAPYPMVPSAREYFSKPTSLLRDYLTSRSDSVSRLSSAQSSGALSVPLSHYVRLPRDRF